MRCGMNGERARSASVVRFAFIRSKAVPGAQLHTNVLLLVMKERKFIAVRVTPRVMSPIGEVGRQSSRDVIQRELVSWVVMMPECRVPRNVRRRTRSCVSVRCLSDVQAV